MDPTTIVVFLLASSGMSIIVTKSYIFKPLRDFIDIGDDAKIAIAKNEFLPNVAQRMRMSVHKLITCPLCFGFWAGAIVYPLIHTEIGYVFCLMLCASIVSMITYSIVYR
ncbi:MAG: DUF1360 domain-containing protein [Gammaproteobacteria bacterium]|nr:DUF1360 domain-containing protein [Gammaproteobacteria bacterium]